MLLSSALHVANMGPLELWIVLCHFKLTDPDVAERQWLRLAPCTPSASQIWQGTATHPTPPPPTHAVVLHSFSWQHAQTLLTG